MNYSDTLEFLFSRRRMGMKYGLERITNLLEDAGNPQNSFKTIHVVGTNGKGSTTAFLSEILMHLNYRVGRITSPHLLDYRERIAVNNIWIPKEKVVEYVELFRKQIETYQATFFEIMTAMAAWHFREMQADVVVAEAGLGGRLDATRLLCGDITIFTGVEIEHQRILGSTCSVIAGEKVAIAKENSILIAWQQTADVEKVIEAAVFRNNLQRITPVSVESAPLPGEHQIRNAGLAFEAAGIFSSYGEELLKTAFVTTCSDLKWRGRLDLCIGNPSILFDVAHNPGSIGYLLDYIRENIDTPVTAVVGFLEDKFWHRMVEQLAPALNSVITTTPLNERALQARELADEFIIAGVDADWRNDISEAVELGRTQSKNILIVTGSFFVVGEAMLAAWKREWIEPPLGESRQIFQ